MNPSLEERKSNTSSQKDEDVVQHQHRRAIPSLETKNSKKGSVCDGGSSKPNNSNRSSSKHNNSQK
jgi:hypothetical protein